MVLRLGLGFRLANRNRNPNPNPNHKPNPNQVSGTLTAVRHLDAISALESVASLSLEASEPGEHIQRTIDLNTCAGAVILLHADRAVVERDYRAIRALQDPNPNPNPNPKPKPKPKPKPNLT